MGTPSNNPLLDHQQYQVEFIDGRIKILTANIMVENFLAQFDDNGHRHLLIDEIEDRHIDEIDIPKIQGTYTTPSIMIRKKRTKRGWEFYMLWKGGSRDRITMKYTKDSYTVPLAYYKMVNEIQDESAFAWWVPFTL